MQIEKDKLYDCIIIGGGVAGLSLSIQLAKRGYEVVLIEKKKYPFHRVCGEYVSMESRHFLQELGMNLTEMHLPKIDTLNITAPNGYKITSKLDLGGFGISRHTLDYNLLILAKNAGVLVLEGCKANNVRLINGIYDVRTSEVDLTAKIVCGSFGKMDPLFINKRDKGYNKKYIAVKYHIKTQLPSNCIELHSFKDGYCGISKVENDTYCLCYLTTSKNLQKCNNDIDLLEKKVLMNNPHLKKYFMESEFVYDKPLVISQIQFSKKSTNQNGILMLGDAAGTIAPLSGNGMSMAMRSSKILTNYISNYLDNKMSRIELIEAYKKEWNKNFSIRIKIGRLLQHLLGNEIVTLVSLKILNKFPALFRKLIALTHGKSY